VATPRHFQAKRGGERHIIHFAPEPEVEGSVKKRRKLKVLERIDAKTFWSVAECLTSYNPQFW